MTIERSVTISATNRLGRRIRYHGLTKPGDQNHRPELRPPKAGHDLETLDPAGHHRIESAGPLDDLRPLVLEHRPDLDIHEAPATIHLEVHGSVAGRRTVATINDEDPATERGVDLGDEHILLEAVHVLHDPDPRDVPHPRQSHGALALKLVDDGADGLESLGDRH